MCVQKCRYVFGPVKEPVIITFFIDTGKPDTEDLLKGLSNSVLEDFLR